MSKSYVTIERCLICSEDTGNLLLDRRLRESFEMYTTFPTSVCDKCKEKYLKKGVLLVNPDSGSLVVLKTRGYKQLFNKPVPSGHIAFVDQEVLNQINEAYQKGGD